MCIVQLRLHSGKPMSVTIACARNLQGSKKSCNSARHHLNRQVSDANYLTAPTHSSSSLLSVPRLLNALPMSSCGPHPA
jgi:hypothetical protein